MKKSKIAASLICGNHLNLKEDLDQLINSKVDLIHFDVMDGVFVPRYGLYPEILAEIKKINNCPPVDVHMMVSNPEEYIDVFAKAGADYYNFHIEATNHSHKIIQKIKSSGMKPGVAINPGTSLEELKWIIKDIQMVVMMTINPGIVGHKFIPEMLQKIVDLKKLAVEHGNNDLIIELDGGVTPETIPSMIKAGANALVCGNGTIFRPHEDTIFNKVNSIKNLIESAC